MTYEEIHDDLVGNGLHVDSIERLLESYTEIRRNLVLGKYPDVGNHVGNFCENAVNILRDHFGVGIESSPDVGTFVNQCESNQIGSGEPVSIRLTTPRLIRAAFELRSRRDTVHTNLEIPVNHIDSQTAAQICTWILGELLREFGPDDDLEKIADEIESLTELPTPGIDFHEGQALITNGELTLKQEILVLLEVADEPVQLNELVKWIPGGSNASIGSSLGTMKRDRLVRYEDKVAIITDKGRKLANEIVRNQLAGDI